MESEAEGLLEEPNKNYGTAGSDGSTSYHSLDEVDERSLETYPMSDLVSSTEHFTRKEITSKVIQTKVLCVLTLLMTCILTILSLVVSQDSDSSAAFGFAFDSFLAGLTSGIILWRFWSVKELERRNRRRELIAHFIIVISLMVTGVLVGYRATKALLDKKRHKKSTMLLVLSSASLLLYFILFIMKYRLAKRLGSRALRTDSIDALCGAILSLSIVITTSTREFTSKAWFLDPIIALGVAVFSLVYGVYSIVGLIKLRREYQEFIKDCEQTRTLSQTVYLPSA